VIGQNGAGKSTLLRLIAGRVAPTAGSAHVQRGTTVAMQAQELVVAPGATVISHMESVFAEDRARTRQLRDVEARLADASDAAELARLLAEQERLHDAHRAAGGFDVDRRIETVLSSLGLGEDAWAQPLEQFSGGERNIVGLAAVLLSDPDVMLLDEPSNHLDMEGVEWFLDFLGRTRAAVVMVSHNRHVLDAGTTCIWELERMGVARWTGNYGAYKRQKAEARALQERQYKAQQREIERIEFQARRLRDMAKAYDDPGQAKRAKSMMKRIERMDKVERPDDSQRRFRARMRSGERHGRIALVVNGFSFAHGDRVLFDNASIEIEYGERVCLVGPNGSGKTTLLRGILEHGSWENPTLRLGKAVKVGEYRQLHDVLDERATLVDWAMRATGLERSGAASLLHRFLFTRDDLDRGIATLSGGEKSRLQLARLVHAEVNFLLLDEPTNHLDIEACEQLEEMLEEWEGTLLVISHDRYFLDRLVERVVEVKDRGLVDHPRGCAEWWDRKRAEGGRARRGALEDRAERTAAEQKEAAKREYEERKEQQREEARRKNRVAEIERTIARVEDEQGAMKERLAELYADPSRLRDAEAAAKEFDALRARLADLYAEWEALV
jgi:ATP-binding cassette subfamily F protein 3